MLKAKIKKMTSKISPIILGVVDSTNNIAVKLAKQGADEGTAIIAARQTAGRGRMGRSFLSKKGGVYLSIILKPKISPVDIPLVTVAAAVAAAGAIEKVSHKKCEIKWVNDVFIDGKKVCGILTEGEINAEGRLDFAVLGIGINLFEPKGHFPPSLPLAASVFNNSCKSFCKSRVKARLIAEFVNIFFEFYDAFGEKRFIKEYQERSFLTGRQITYTKDGKSYTATVLGIDDNANLVVKSGCETQNLSHGEIQIVGMEQPII